MATQIDFSTASLNKFGEECCGNIVEVIRDETGVTALFVDGEGDGTGASVTALFFMRMAKAMLKNPNTVTSVIQTVAEIYCDTGNREAPLGFMAVHVNDRGEASFASMNMPLPILLNMRKLVDYPLEHIKAGSRVITATNITLKSGTSLLFFNDALLHVGEGQGIGWQRDEIAHFLREAYKPGQFGAGKITQMLLYAAKSLEKENPSHDLSVLTLQYTHQPKGKSNDLQDIDVENI